MIPIPNIRPVDVIPQQIIQPENTVVAHGNWTTVGRRNLRTELKTATLIGCERGGDKLGWGK